MRGILMAIVLLHFDDRCPKCRAHVAPYQSVRNDGATCAECHTVLRGSRDGGARDIVIPLLMGVVPVSFSNLFLDAAVEITLMALWVYKIRKWVEEDYRLR